MRKTKKRIYLTTLKNFLAKIFKFGLFPVRSPLVRELRCSLFLRLLRCFTSAGSLFIILCNEAIPVYGTRFPHSDTSGLQVTTHLPEDFAVTLRPSSPFCVKASTIRPCVALIFYLYRYVQGCISTTFAYINYVHVKLLVKIRRFSKKF